MRYGMILPGGSLLAGVCSLLAGAALAQTVVIEARGAESPEYREVSGEWADSPSASMAPEAPIDFPGSRSLRNPSPGAPAIVEFRPPIRRPGEVRVSMTWPAGANAQGLMLSLEGSDPPQFHPVSLAPRNANTWREIGVFRLDGATPPVFRLSTTTGIGPVEATTPLSVVIDSIRFAPLDPPAAAATAAPDTATATTSTFGQPVASTGENPFGTAAPTGPLPFNTGTSGASPFETTGATAASPFGNEPARSPFDRQATPPALSPIESPSRPADDPFVVVPSPSAATVAPPDPFADDSVPIALPSATRSEAPAVEAGASVAPVLEYFPASTPAPGGPVVVVGANPDPPAPDPFTEGGAGTPGPDLPKPFVRDSTKPLAVIGGDDAAATGGGRVITTDLPQPAPSRAPVRTLATALIVSDSELFAASGKRPLYNPLFDAVRRAAADDSAERVVEILWASTLSEAESRSTREGRPLIMVFYDENTDSQSFSLDVLARARVGEAMNRGIPVRLPAIENRQLAASLHIGPTPYVVVRDKFGFTRGHISERKNPDAFLEQLNGMLQ